MLYQLSYEATQFILSFIKFESFTGTHEPKKMTCSEMSGFITQLAVEHCTSIAEDISFSFESRRIHLNFSSVKKRQPFRGCRDGAVVRALASHQCGPGSIPRLGDSASYVARVEFVGSPLCTERFSLGTPVSPLLKNQHLTFDLICVNC